MSRFKIPPAREIRIGRPAHCRQVQIAPNSCLLPSIFPAPGAFRIIPHNSASFRLFFCAPKGAAFRLISAFQRFSVSGCEFRHRQLSTPKTPSHASRLALQIGADSSSQRNPATPDSSRSATFQLELSAPIWSYLDLSAPKTRFPNSAWLSTFAFLFSTAASFPISDF